MKQARHKVFGVFLLLMALFPWSVSAQVVITKQPQSQTVAAGATLTLTVEATGNGPLSFQWRLNGVNIPGANSPLFTVPNFQSSNAGDYSVAVADSTGAINSDVARIRPLGLDNLPFTDNMSGNNQITGLTGSGGGTNIGATREPGEPDHAGKHGRNSVWLTWSPGLLGGVATFDAAGSSFDTLLAVYTGDSVGNLTLVASNDDRSNCEDPPRGFHTSRVRFNARAGTVYHIAVDGLEGAAGDIVLSWNVNLLEGLLTVVNIVPGLSVVLPGGSLNLSVNAQGLGLTYQWYLNCQPIPGATLSSLQLVNLQPANVGDYTVHIRDLLGVETASDAANVQLNVTDGKALDVSALDKFLESSDAARTSLAAATSRLQRASFRRSPIRKMSGGPARGYRGTQVFSTVGATKDPGEPNHCGETGGASEWYAYQPPASGLLTLDTEGSTFDTVLAVYTGPGTDFESLVSVACDNNSGSDGKTSKVVFHATKDTVYYIAVDGVGGASGTVNLNYVLKIPPTISSIAGLTTDEDTPLFGVAFTVSNGDTAATNFTVTGSSSNPVLVPNENISFSGAGTNRTATLTPATNQYGMTTITITVTDADGQTSSTSFLLTVNAVNDRPTLTGLSDQFTDEDTPAPALTFSIADAETAAGSLTLTGHSSNPDLVPDGNIVFGGSGPNRTVTVTPAANRSGTAMITVTVADPEGATASGEFLLTVNAVNDPPTLTGLSDQFTDEDTPTPALAFSIADVETAAGSLTLTGHSSDSVLVPDSNIVFGGSGSNRTVMVTPAANRSGTAMITVTVADPEGATTSGTFLLTVNPVNDPPTISFVPDQQTIEGTATAPISLHVEDIETPAENLALSGSSSNTNLVPNANLVFGGAGAERTVTVTPAALQTGTAVISVTVTDADGGATTRGFLLTVTLGQPLQFISSAMLSDGSFRMRLAGAPLQGTVIQVSSDLANWQPVFTNSDQASVVEWTDVSATNSAGRCYRAVR